MNISSALKFAVAQLSNTSDTAKLDAELLLAKVLGKPRSYLIAYPEQELTLEQQQQFQELIEKRTTKYPLAYLVGEKEFWSLNFVVNENVLIPRPETELLIEKILSLFSSEKNLTVIDLGTGSGAIACALAHEKPQWQIIATDQSEAALVIAKKNVQRLNLTNITFYQGSWCHALPQGFKANIIVSNPPYLAVDDMHLIDSEIAYEPISALVAADDGLANYEIIASQTKQYLTDSGYLFFEHGAEQAEAIHDIFRKNGYQNIQHERDLAGLMRITWAVC